MQSQDLQVLSHLADWLESGHTCHLCTIVATYGSSPRPAGSLLAVNAEGGLAGSLSGGCVEDDLLTSLRAGERAQAGPQRIDYGVTPEETERMGLPCGGTLSIVAERLEPDAENRVLYRNIVEALEARQCVTRSVHMGSRVHAEIKIVEGFAPLELVSRNDRTEVLRQTYGPRRQLFLVGANLVSRYLAEMAGALEYDVTVCDPRAELLDQWDLQGVTRLCAMPDDAILARANDAHSAIVALTHDARIDDMAMLAALESRAFYVGAMGSLATSRKRRDRLAALGLPAQAIERLHAPVGIPIGSKTPAEIAISILAELTEVVRAENCRTDALSSIQRASTA